MVVLIITRLVREVGVAIVPLDVFGEIPVCFLERPNPDALIPLQVGLSKSDVRVRLAHAQKVPSKASNVFQGFPRLEIDRCQVPGYFGLDFYWS